jgi:hypothetical protein
MDVVAATIPTAPAEVVEDPADITASLRQVPRVYEKFPV